MSACTEAWDCHACTYSNHGREATFLQCGACGTTRASDDDAASARPAVSGVEQQSTARDAASPAASSTAAARRPPPARPPPTLRPPPAKRRRGAPASKQKASVYLVPSEAAFAAIKERFPRARKALAELKWGGLLHATMLRFDDADGAHRDLERIAGAACAAGVRALNGRAFRLPAACWDSRGGIAGLRRLGDMAAALEAMLGVLRDGPFSAITRTSS